MVDMFVGAVIGAAGAALVAGGIAFIKRKVSVKSKMELRVNKLEKQQKHTAEYLSDFCPVMIRGIRAILKNLLQGEKNGVVKKALEELEGFMDEKSKIYE